MYLERGPLRRHGNTHHSPFIASISMLFSLKLVVLEIPVSVPINPFGSLFSQKILSTNASNIAWQPSALFDIHAHTNKTHRHTLFCKLLFSRSFSVYALRPIDRISSLPRFCLIKTAGGLSQDSIALFDHRFCMVSAHINP